MQSGFKQIYSKEKQTKNKMEKKFTKRIGKRSQKWTIKVQNNIRKASELLTRLLNKGWKLLEDITFKKGFYSFKVEWI